MTRRRAFATREFVRYGVRMSADEARAFCAIERAHGLRASSVRRCVEAHGIRIPVWVCASWRPAVKP